MAQKVINNSTTIAVLESKIISDLCVGKFYIDLTPSVYKTNTSAQNVLGAKIKIVNPYGVPLKEYNNTYDILPPLSATYVFDIPTENGNYQFGTYIISIQFTDADSTIHELVENATICQPNENNKRAKEGIILADIKGVCNLGKVRVLIDEPPAYQGVLSESKTQSFKLTFPAGTIQTPITSTSPNFEGQLFEGIYKLTGNVCALYNYGENNYARVPYLVSLDKNIRCRVDSCAISARMLQITADLAKDDCKNKDYLNSVILDAIIELETIRLAIDCGEDVTENIERLYALLGIECIIGNIGTPVTPIVTPTESIVVNGCNVTSSLNGLTRTYNIDNYSYEVEINAANNSFVVISPAVLNGCAKKQTLTFDIGALYNEIKGQVTIQNDFVSWANIVKEGRTITPANLVCLGITATQYAAMDESGFFNHFLSKFCGCCGSSTCNAVISTLTAALNGQNTILSWLNNADVFELDIYVDAQLQDTVLLNAVSTQVTINGILASYTLTGFNDEQDHSVRIFAKCQDGTKGNDISVVFNHTGCPTIFAPSLNTNSVPNASCPFNLNTVIQGAIPNELTLTWHNQNNNNASSLIANPASVTSGTYYAFYKDANNCSSPSSIINIVCQQAGNCSEPLNVLVQVGNNSNLITHSAATFAPASYLVKRRLASASNVPANYTNIGTSVFNAGTNKYEIADTSALQNTLYVYRVESQCTDNSRPYTDYQFANITCPVIVGVGATNAIDYSFTHVGGQVDKYVVELYNNAGTTLINSITELPAFASPITGTFNGLNAAATYKVRVKAYIGTVEQVCRFINVLVDDIVNTTFSATISRTSTQLVANINNGTPPYTYAFSIIDDGVVCASHTMVAPTGTTNSQSVSTAYTTAQYTNAVYNFSVTVTDANSNTVNSNTLTENACLVPETIIDCANNRRLKLGNLKVGDLLYGENEITAFRTLKVNKIFVINDGLLKCSESHLHPLANGDFKKTEFLVEGDALLHKDGTELLVNKVEIIHGEFDVIDISTKTGYYIANNVLTHNKNACP